MIIATVCDFEPLSLEGLFRPHTSPLRCFSTLRYIEANLDEPFPHSPPFNGLLVELERFPAQNILESVSITVAACRKESLRAIKNDFQALITFLANGIFPAFKEVHLATDWCGSDGALASLLPFSNFGDIQAHPKFWNFSRPNLGFDVRFHFKA